jgi:glucoamylase
MMAILLQTNPATGGPGINPRWTRSDKEGVGTAYGQREDGGPFQGSGYGHAWLMLTGERGHYELAAGRDVQPYIRAKERFASSTKLLPEQIWAFADLPNAHMIFGRPTGGVMPLSWANAEYIKLVRFAMDGQVIDLIPEVTNRYRNPRKAAPLEVWTFNRQVRSLLAGGTLRIQAVSPFRLHWTSDEWKQAHDTDSLSIETAHEYVDIRVSPKQRAPIRFTFFWTAAGHWEGWDFHIGINAVRKAGT